MRAEKQLYLDEVKQKLEGTALMMLLRYQNFEANLNAGFRKEICEAGGEFTVVNKRVLKKAAEEVGIKITDALEGHIAIVTSKQSPIDGVKQIFKFRKANEALIEVVGGNFEGQTCTAQDFEKVANLPSQDEMRSQLLAVFEAPAAQTLSVMQTIVSVMPTLLQNKAEKEE